MTLILFLSSIVVYFHSQNFNEVYYNVGKAFALYEIWCCRYLGVMRLKVVRRNLISVVFSIVFLSLLMITTFVGVGFAGGNIPWGKLIPSSVEPVFFNEKELVGKTLSLLRKGGAVSEQVKGEGSERLVLLSVSNGKSINVTSYGVGRGIYVALADAVNRLREKKGNLSDVRWFKVYIPRDMEFRRMANIQKPLPMERGLWGLAFPGCDNCIFAPEDVLAKKIINDKGVLQPPSIGLWGDLSAEKMIKSMLETKRADYVAFRTESVFWDGSRAQHLYRGSPLYHVYAEQDIIESTRLAAYYLLRVMDSKGKFTYIYDPIKDRSKGGYNMLRHAGTIFSMLQYYEETGDEEVLKGAQRAIKYMLSKVKTFRKNGEEMACLVEGDYVKLGGNGLAVLSLAKYMEATGDNRYMPLVKKMGEWMVSVQDESGRFFVHKQVFPEGEVSDFRSVYYPGEAIFALAVLGRLDGENSDKWLEAAERGARYIIEIRDGKKQDIELPHDHWLLYGMDELSRSGRDKEGIFLKHALRLARIISNAQYKDSYYPDWIGGFGKNPRSTPAATRMEGIGAAYRMAKRAGLEEEAKDILRTFRLGGGFLLRMQIGPSWAMHLKNPSRSIGGVRRSFSNFEIRIDYVQHNLSALLALQQVLRE